MGAALSLLRRLGALNSPADVLVLGGGPAGCAAAIGLARTGARVTILERERAASPKVCGEFLSVEACAHARSAGVDLIALGAAPIDRVRVAWRGIVAESRLPFVAQSVSRAAFDEAMLAAAQRAGVRVERGARVLNIEGGRVSVRTGEHSETRQADAIVLATGKADLTGARRAGASMTGALGFKMHLECDAAVLEELGSAVELSVFAGGYAGMQRVEGGRVALAVAIDRTAYARLGSWEALTSSLAERDPRFARRFRAARELWPKPLAVSGVPYGFVHRDEPHRDESRQANAAIYRVGDQVAVIPSFTGDGIAIALVTGAFAAAAIARGDSPVKFHTDMRRKLAKPMLVSSAVSSLITSTIGRAALVGTARLAPNIFRTVATHTRIESVAVNTM